MPGPGRIAVIDHGKTNIRVSACTDTGVVLETLSVPNTVQPGPPWGHHDLAGLGDWVFANLAELCKRHPIAHVIASGHGSGGVLVLDDPDAGGDGAALPMIDYEQPVPSGLDADYVPLSGGFFDRGSRTMMAATHQARQMFWMARAEPSAFARARWYLGVPQYWAWRLSGVAASETTSMGAQSHLWNVPDRRWAPIVTGQGWVHLLPAFAPSWAVLGPLRPALARHYGLPDGLSVHCGVHDSSANFYRYQAGGLSDLAVVSTGTWVVAMSDSADLCRLDETRNMTCNSDVAGNPLAGALTMAGREFSAVAGIRERGRQADLSRAAAMIAQDTMALPSFGSDDGQFPGSSGRGRIQGPQPATPEDRLALAVLYAALLTTACIDTLGPQRRVILDGAFLQNPAYAELVAGLRPDVTTLASGEGYGVAAGAALLCGHDARSSPAPLDLTEPTPAVLPGLAEYAARWRRKTLHSLKGQDA